MPNALVCRYGGQFGIWNGAFVAVCVCGFRVRESSEQPHNPGLRRDKLNGKLRFRFSGSEEKNKTRTSNLVPELLSGTRIPSRLVQDATEGWVRCLCVIISARFMASVGFYRNKYIFSNSNSIAPEPVSDLNGG